MPDDTQKFPLDGATTSSQEPAVSRPNKLLFNAAELRLVRHTAILLCLVALTALVGIIVWTVGWIVNVFYNLLLPLSLAGVLALVLYPVVDFVESRCRLPRLLATLLLVTVFILGIAGMIFLLVPIISSQIVELMTVLPDILASWRERFAFHFPELSSMIFSSMESSGENGEGEKSAPVLEYTGRTIMSSLGLLVGIGFVPLFLFFTLLSGGSLRAQASEILSVFQKTTQEKVLYFMDVFVEYVTAFFQGQLIIAVCMGTLYAIGFTLIGLNYGVLIGLVLGLLNIVPFLGTLIGLLVVLPTAYLQPDGGVQLLVLSGLVFAAVQVVESFLLTPKIMANRSGLHPALVVISLFFWGTALSGIIGMVLAVPLTAFLVAIWSEIKTSLKRNLSAEDTR